jgi:YidC/Oxa1 family membrane protein insertase
MDKKYFLIGIAALFLAMFLSISEGHRPSAEVPPVAAAPLPTAGESAISLPRAQRSARTIAVLENEFVRVEIGEGGGIRFIALHRYPAELGGEEPWRFDDYDRSADALALGFFPADGSAVAPETVEFTTVAQTPSSALLRGKLPDGSSVEREYRLQEGTAERGDPYELRHWLRISAPDDSPRSSSQLAILLGSLPPTAGDPSGYYLNFAAYDGKKARFTSLRHFDASRGFFGIGRHAARASSDDARPVHWAAVKNQFFAAILTPVTPGLSSSAAPIELEKCGRGVRGWVRFAIPTLEEGESFSLPMGYYVGPKEFTRLERLGQNQDLIMQFGWCGFISKLLLLSMKGIHRLVHNWGLTIILLTALVKLILWPLTTAQVRSTRGMSRIQEPLKALQARYKNHPKKLRNETLHLFRAHRVNPAAGCLPIFIQIPIFLGLYYMLRSASELRFAGFLWIRDLSTSDTIAHLGRFPINPLPILMGATTYLQMRLTPSAPMSGAQRNVLRLMPLIFLGVCYGLPSGLTLYWTAQNVFTIFQQTLVQRRLAAEKLEPARGDKKSKKSGRRGKVD